MGGNNFMNANEVVLKFDPTLSNLAGYDFGLKIYEEQVKGKIDLSEGFTIVFPKNIVGVAASFVQGFFSDIIKTLGLLSTKDKVSIIAVDNQLSEAIKKKID